MKELKQFFLFCSGVDKSILKQCPSDDNKYVGIGATIFFTGLLAFVSSAYALFTVFDSWMAALFMGVIWGLMIFNLDRYIVSSMKIRDGVFGNFFVALPRLAMAVLLALVISKPLELKIFEKEINSELIVMEQEVYKEQEEGISARFSDQIDVLKSDILVLKEAITTQTEMRDAKALAALQEADGSGGSQVRNMGPIYKAKKADADQAQKELDDILATNQPLISDKTAKISQLDLQIAGNIEQLERGAFGGLAARTEALARLGQGSEAIYFASLLIMFLFVAVETAPIFVKLISPRSPYDYLLQEHEHQFEMATKQSTTVRKNDVLNHLKVHTEVGIHKAKADISAKKGEIDTELQRHLGALRNGSYTTS